MAPGDDRAGERLIFEAESPNAGMFYFRAGPGIA
jgi:hypothetical protein